MCLECRRAESQLREIEVMAMAAHWDRGGRRRGRGRGGDEDVRLKRNENQSIHLQSRWAPEVIIHDIKQATSAEELIQMLHERGGTTERENGDGDVKE